MSRHDWTLWTVCPVRGQTLIPIPRRSGATCSNNFTGSIAPICITVKDCRTPPSGTVDRRCLSRPVDGLRIVASTPPTDDTTIGGDTARQLHWQRDWLSGGATGRHRLIDNSWTVSNQPLDSCGVATLQFHGVYNWMVEFRDEGTGEVGCSCSNFPDCGPCRGSPTTDHRVCCILQRVAIWIQERDGH